MKPSLLFASALTECRLGGAAARSDDEVDVSDFVAVTDERLADHYAIDLGHYGVSFLHLTKTNAAGARF